MNKKIFILALFVLAFSVFVAPQAQSAATNFDLTKEKWVENHYDAQVFTWQEQVCAAGPYSNEIRTYCSVAGQNTWEASTEGNVLIPPTLTDGDGEFINLEKVVVWNDVLFYVVERGASGNSNNDTQTTQVWRLESDNTWTKVFSYQNNYTYYLDLETTDKRMYMFLYRYDTNPAQTFYYTTKDGVNWNKVKRTNSPKNIAGIAVANGKLYAYNSTNLYERRDSGYWRKKYVPTSTDTVYNYITGLTSFNDKLYITQTTYTYDSVGQASDPMERKITTDDSADLGYTVSYNIMSSKNGKTWKSKKLNDKSINGGETSKFYSDGEKLWLLATHTGEKRDVLWRVTKNVNDITTAKHKKIIPKTSGMRSNNYYLINYIQTGSYYYFTDNHGNIYSKK